MKRRLFILVALLIAVSHHSLAQQGLAVAERQADCHQRRCAGNPHQRLYPRQHSDGQIE